MVPLLLLPPILVHNIALEVFLVSPISSNSIVQHPVELDDQHPADFIERVFLNRLAAPHPVAQALAIFLANAINH